MTWQTRKACSKSTFVNQPHKEISEGTLCWGTGELKMTLALFAFTEPAVYLEETAADPRDCRDPEQQTKWKESNAASQVIVLVGPLPSERLPPKAANAQI